MSIIILVIFCLFIPRTLNVRSFYLNLIVTVYLIPSLVLYSFGNQPTISAVIIWTAIAIIYVISAIKMPTLRISRVDPNIIIWTITIWTLLLLTVYISLGGLSYFNLNIWRVYEFRAKAAAVYPELFGYLGSITTKVLIPLGIVLAFIKRKYILLALLLLTSICSIHLLHYLLITLLIDTEDTLLFS